MVPSDIENIDVTPIDREGSNILAHAKIKLTCGLVLSGIRIYKDLSDKSEIFLSFPTRKDREGGFEKTYFPFNQQTRAILTDMTKEIYNAKTANK